MFYMGVRDNKYYIYNLSEKNVIKDVNLILDNSLESTLIPTTPTRRLTVYFPEKTPYNIKEYLLEVKIKVGRREFYLCSVIINNLDLLASESGFKYNDIRYFEEYSVNIPDPFSILYEDYWKVIREGLFFEKPDTNNTETQLMVYLTPVVNGVISEEGGSSFLRVVDNNNNISCNMKYDKDFNICTNVTFNPVYEGDFWLYLQETYDIYKFHGDYTLSLDTVLKDQDNIYKHWRTDLTEKVKINNIYNKNELNLSWDNWVPGMNFESSISLTNGEDEVFTIFSNPLPVTLDTFSYLLAKGERLNLNEIDMEVYNLDVVNKVEKRIVNVTNLKDEKSNIINNVFVFTNKIEQLEIYPTEKQNILLPLNGFKSKVDVFNLKIEGVVFPEIGRTQQGVVFCVDGNLLPNETTQGEYFILNSKKELVTTGKYIYK